MIRALALVAMLAPTIAWACPAGETEVFSCSAASGERIQVCQAQQVIRFELRPAGPAPAKVISSPNSKFKWMADGGSALDTIDLLFESGTTTHRVSAARFREGPDELDAQVHVASAGRKSEVLYCLTPSLRLHERAIKAPRTSY